jgi:hypothetical protein
MTAVGPIGSMACSPRLSRPMTWLAERRSVQRRNKSLPETRRASRTRTRMVVGTTRCLRVMIDPRPTSRADHHDRVSDIARLPWPQSDGPPVRPRALRPASDHRLSGAVRRFDAGDGSQGVELSLCDGATPLAEWSWADLEALPQTEVKVDIHWRQEPSTWQREARHISIAHAAFKAAGATGSFRRRLPVAAKIALATAGAIAAVPGSPIPPGACVLETRCTSMTGASLMRRGR